jgi:hypothetical protein
MQATQTLPRLCSGPFSNRGFEHNGNNLSALRLATDRGQYQLIGLELRHRKYLKLFSFNLCTWVI